jgi:hypothetical protein
MEHVIKQQRDGQQVRLTAEKGWLLKSKKSGKAYREIETLDLKRWEVIPDADTKDTVATESAGKPKTAKRTNRKGK